MNISGTGCNGAEIRGNTFSDNAYGIYLSGNAQPLIEYNNFSGNSTFGLYNASSISVTADLNHWGSAQGPDAGANAIQGDVSVDAWLNQAYSISTPTNHAPVAVADSADTNEDTPVIVNVLPNDSDPGNDTLSLGGFTQPLNGIVTDSGNGALTYTPNSNFNGDDSFSYAVTDCHISVNASVHIVIAPTNDAPVAEAGANQSVTVNHMVSLDGQGSSDLDGDPLTYQWSFISKPQDSQASFVMPGLVENQFTADVAGSYEILLTVNDGSATATDSVLITVIGAPTVGFAAEPPLISQGQTSTLTWTTVNAETVTITPDIGNVALSWSVTVSPTSATAYTLTATGPGGVKSTSALVTIDTPFVLQIDAPLDQQTIHRPSVLVSGIILNSTGLETGVTVNGMPALKYKEQFMANHVPLVQGQNTITVTATDTAGRAQSTSISVNADTSGQHCISTVLPESGLAPYTGVLKIEAPMVLTRTTVLDYGPEGIKFGQGPPEQVPLTINLPGLYWFEINATGADGGTYYDEIAVLVYDVDQLDTLLKAKWNAMKARMAAGDVAGAVADFSNATRQKYETIFTSLGDQLPLIAQQMQEIERVDAGEGYAKYRIQREEIIDGQSYSVIYDIYFSPDENGVWKIDLF